MKYEEKLERVKGLREKYPKMDMIEMGCRLINLIFACRVDDKVCDAYFKELEEILEKLS
jgi:hypothetical protein